MKFDETPQDSESKESLIIKLESEVLMARYKSLEDLVLGFDTFMGALLVNYSLQLTCRIVQKCVWLFQIQKSYTKEQVEAPNSPVNFYAQLQYMALNGEFKNMQQLVKVKLLETKLNVVEVVIPKFTEADEHQGLYDHSLITELLTKYPTVELMLKDIKSINTNLRGIGAGRINSILFTAISYFREQENIPLVDFLGPLAMYYSKLCDAVILSRHDEIEGIIRNRPE